MLPSGRSLGHSLLLLAPLVLIAAVAVRYRDTTWGEAFAIGVLSHTVVDVLPALIRGELAYTTPLVWPLLLPPPYNERDRTILGHFLSLESTPMVTFELVLALVALVVWWRRGRPGIDTIRAVVVNRDR